MTSVKLRLYQECLAYVVERIATARQAIEAAQASSNEETKSSAGDKYETGRAMAQLEIEKNTEQLGEALKLKQTLETLSERESTRTVQAGSLVATNQGNFYISIPAGKLVIDNITYFAISLDSPIGGKLRGLNEGSSFNFRGKEFYINQIV